MPKIRRALISVFDKTGIVEFARMLQQSDVELISTGGTAAHLTKNRITVQGISEITQFPEILDGRVKTLHPKIFGGLLCVRNNQAHIDELHQNAIDLIDMVVINLYPFEKVISKNDASEMEALENIDIGGPSLIRAAAKNYKDVVVVTSPDQYETLNPLLKDGEVDLETRKSFAQEAFALTSGYDSVINHYFSMNSTTDSRFPEKFDLHLKKIQDLRYGENPHQKAALYEETGKIAESSQFIQHHGKELSFNNIVDLDAAFGIVHEFDEPCCAIIKHTNPCGVAIGKTLCDAYKDARACDPVSAFGGVVAVNRPIDLETVNEISEIFTEVVIAPSYEPETLDRLRSKKNLRIISAPESARAIFDNYDFKKVARKWLLQDQDFYNINDINFRVVSKRQPRDEEWNAIKFGWRVCKWVKSNAIVYTTACKTVGIGAGQMSRVDASKLAIEKAKSMGHSLRGTVLSSDAFFPFRDGIDVGAKAGATAVVQPGGSVRDQEVIEAGDEHNMAMVFTGVRHFRH